jgi:hypothetical protein
MFVFGDQLYDPGKAGPRIARWVLIANQRST